MKKTKKSLLLSTISLVLCIAMLVGTTFAWFTDSVTSGKNKIVAGNLDIDLMMDKAQDGTYVSIADEDAAIFGGENSLVAQNKSSDTLWEPGKTQVVFLGVKNLGTLAAKYNILLTVTDNGLASALEYAIIDGAKASDMTSVTDWAGVQSVNGAQTGSMGDFTYDDTTKQAIIPAAQDGVLDEGKDEIQYFALAVHMSEDAGNEYMGKDVVIDVLIEATQYTSEYDSFDNQYDKQEEEQEPECLTFTCTGLDEYSDPAGGPAMISFRTDYPDLFADIELEFKPSSTNVQYGDYDSTSPVTGTDWQTYEPGSVLALEVGDSVQFRGNNATYAVPNPDDDPTWEGDEYAYWNFWMSGSFEGSGDVTSLTNGVGGDAQLTDNCYCNMFIGCVSLTTAPRLPAKTLAANCYYSMFAYCMSLTTTPALPATKVAPGCYYEMFRGCTSLQTASKLPATDLSDGDISAEYSFDDYGAYTLIRDQHGCYERMFMGCSALTEAPELPATKLANCCYAFMFSGCTSLEEAPALPAKTLARYCYDTMFGCFERDDIPGCTSLTKAPALPATTLSEWCYLDMFRGCTALETAPALPAENMAEYCYSGMFMSCTSLKVAPALTAKNLAAGCYGDMFKSCTSMEVAPALPATKLAKGCYGGMFANCESLTTVPVLPASELAEECYDAMFWYCTSLETAPALPAATLAVECYQYMFYGCTSLTTAPALPATTLFERCYFCMFDGCTSLYVRNSANGDAAVAWTVPASGTFTNTEACIQEFMFHRCKDQSGPGNMAGAAGQSYTYYTQNTPVSAN